MTDDVVTTHNSSDILTEGMKKIEETFMNGRTNNSPSLSDQQRLKRCLVTGTFNWQACLKMLMKMDGAKELCQDCSVWRDVISY